MNASPLRRYAEPEDMAGPAFFLCSDDSRYVTGQYCWSMAALQRRCESCGTKLLIVNPPAYNFRQPARHT